MARAFVIEADAANRLSRGAAEQFDDEPLFKAPGVTRVDQENITYFIGDGATSTSRLLVVCGGPDGPLRVGTPSSRAECFNRILRAGLSQFWPGFVKLP